MWQGKLEYLFRRSVFICMPLAQSFSEDNLLLNSRYPSQLVDPLEHSLCVTCAGHLRSECCCGIIFLKPPSKNLTFTRRSGYLTAIGERSKDVHCQHRRNYSKSFTSSSDASGIPFCTRQEQQPCGDVGSYLIKLHPFLSWLLPRHHSP